MIELPEGPRTASVTYLDRGFLQRGGETTRINKKGSRHMISFSYGPFTVEKGNDFVSLLLAAKSEGVRVSYPLQEYQGAAGSPVVDGAGQTGTTLAIKGLNVGYYCRPRFWLSIVDQTGRHYLHNVKTGGIVGADGLISIVITPELRHPFLDAAVIHLEKPMVEGWIDGEEWSWSVSVDRVIPIQFTLEEAK